MERNTNAGSFHAFTGTPQFAPGHEQKHPNDHVNLPFRAQAPWHHAPGAENIEIVKTIRVKESIHETRDVSRYANPLLELTDHGKTDEHGRQQLHGFAKDHRLQPAPDAEHKDMSHHQPFYNNKDVDRDIENAKNAFGHTQPYEGTETGANARGRQNQGAPTGWEQPSNQSARSSTAADVTVKNVGPGADVTVEIEQAGGAAATAAGDRGRQTAGSSTAADVTVKNVGPGADVTVGIGQTGGAATTGGSDTNANQNAASSNPSGPGPGAM